MHLGAFASFFLSRSLEGNVIQVDVISRMMLSSHFWPLAFQPELKHAFFKKPSLPRHRQKSPQIPVNVTPLCSGVKTNGAVSKKTNTTSFILLLSRRCGNIPPRAAGKVRQ